MEPILETRGLRKEYGRQVVLDDVHLCVHAGSFTVVTGRSGSGKSTLFKLLAGLDRPTSGDVLVEGRNLASMDDGELSLLRMRRIGLVFQSFNLLPDLSVAENVRLPLDIAGVPRREGAGRAAELLETLHVAPLAGKLPHEISGGEQQRVAIARALANRPAIVLADEPTGNLDRRNAENVVSALEEINREHGATILVITHDPLVVERSPDRLEIDEGRLARAGAGAHPTRRSTSR